MGKAAGAQWARHSLECETALLSSESATKELERLSCSAPHRSAHTHSQTPQTYTHTYSAGPLTEFGNRTVRSIRRHKPRTNRRPSVLRRPA